MKKKLLTLLISCAVAFSCVGCGSESVQVNVSNSENVSSNQFGQFVNIGGKLVYDSATKIVYMKNYTYNMNAVYTPYYAPNGFPYKYNLKNNTFEEIDFDNKETFHMVVGER